MPRKTRLISQNYIVPCFPIGIPWGWYTSVFILSHLAPTSFLLLFVFPQAPAPPSHILQWFISPGLGCLFLSHNSPAANRVGYQAEPSYPDNVIPGRKRDLQQKHTLCLPHIPDTPRNRGAHSYKIGSPLHSSGSQDLETKSGF